MGQFQKGDIVELKSTGPKPTVSPAKNSLVYFISIVYIDHLGWGSHREEAKRGPPSGHRITRNGAAMVSWLLPYAPVCAHRVVPHRGVVGDRCNPWGQPRAPVLCIFRRPFMARPVPRQLLRNALLDLTTIVPATTYHRGSYAERYSRSTQARRAQEVPCTPGLLPACCSTRCCLRPRGLVSHSPLAWTDAWLARESRRSAVTQTFPFSGLCVRCRASTLHLAEPPLP